MHCYSMLFLLLLLLINSLVGVQAPPEPWFQDRETYEFHVSNRAPMKKDMTQAPEW
jgi:hypothetical protein